MHRSAALLLRVMLLVLRGSVSVPWRGLRVSMASIPLLLMLWALVLVLVVWLMGLGRTEAVAQGSSSAVTRVRRGEGMSLAMRRS